jgi:hypothetical protein
MYPSFPHHFTPASTGISQYPEQQDETVNQKSIYRKPKTNYLIPLRAHPCIVSEFLLYNQFL